MNRRIFSFALCATLYCIAVTSVQAQQAGMTPWQPIQANVASPVIQAQALVPVPPVLRTAQVIPAQQLQPAPMYQQQPPVITGPPLPAPSASYDMYTQPSYGAAPSYAAPAYGPTLSSILPPSGPGCDTACGMPGFFAFAEFFQWDTFVNQPALAVQSTAPMGVPPTVTNRPLRTNFSSDTGFRIGAGWRFMDGWDIGVIYTDFDNRAASTAGVVPPAAEGDPLLIFPIPFALGDVDAATENISLDYQVYDFEAGRKFCICRTLILRPFFGLRFGELDYSQSATYFDFMNAGVLPADPADDVIDTETLLTRTSMDGVGPRLGSLVSWNIGGSGFQIFTRGSLSLLWSDITIAATDTVNNDFNNVPAVDAVQTYRESYEKIVPVAELAIGVRFEANGFFLSGGYEAQNWFDVLDDPFFFGPTGPTFNPASDIGFGGYFVRGGYNF